MDAADSLEARLEELARGCKAAQVVKTDHTSIRGEFGLCASARGAIKARFTERDDGSIAVDVELANYWQRGAAFTLDGPWRVILTSAGVARITSVDPPAPSSKPWTPTTVAARSSSSGLGGKAAKLWPVLAPLYVIGLLAGVSR
jgi:hypothetical protein